MKSSLLFLRSMSIPHVHSPVLTRTQISTCTSQTHHKSDSLHWHMNMHNVCVSDNSTAFRNLRFQALLMRWPPSKAPPLPTSAALLLFLPRAQRTQTSSDHWPCLCVWRPVRIAWCVASYKLVQRNLSLISALPLDRTWSFYLNSDGLQGVFKSSLSSGA